MSSNAHFKVINLFVIISLNVSHKTAIVFKIKLVCDEKSEGIAVNVYMCNI